MFETLVRTFILQFEFVRHPFTSERELAEEQAKIDRLAREEAKDQARVASAQNNAFQLGKEGKGAEMRILIEKFCLDVTRPRKLNSKKDPKSDKETGFETMLHVAAGSCDVALIDWLLGRGMMHGVQMHIHVTHNTQGLTLRLWTHPILRLSTLRFCVVTYLLSAI